MQIKSIKEFAVELMELLAVMLYARGKYHAGTTQIIIMGERGNFNCTPCKCSLTLNKELHELNTQAPPGITGRTMNWRKTTRDNRQANRKDIGYDIIIKETLASAAMYQFDKN
jgi:hypothetical protein